jgi:hypothetical protein
MRTPPAWLIGLLLGVLLVLVGCSPTDLQAARNQCVVVQDDTYVTVEGDKMSLDVATAGMDQAGISIETFDCIANALAVPADLLREIKDNETVAARILNNGWQHETFDDFDISWIYHNALFVIIQEK